MMKNFLTISLVFSVLVGVAFANPAAWRGEWPNTDFTRSSVEFGEIFSGGPPKDGIPAIDDPIFKGVREIKDIGDKEAVITLKIRNDVRAYPIRILMYHEIVNDTVGGVPVAITYCPLCNSSLVFDRTFEGRVLDFGTTGKLRFSDLVMYDRQTESWWQQFIGTGIVGEYTGKKLTTRSSRIESFSRFKARHPQGKVLVPSSSNARRYGTNPYVSYDSANWPFLYTGKYNHKSVSPMERLVVVGNDAWPLSFVEQQRKITYKGLEIRWEAGQHSSLDTRIITAGRDIGNVTVTKNGEDVFYDVPFAFAFLAFHPEGTIHSEK